MANRKRTDHGEKEMMSGRPPVGRKHRVGGPISEYIAKTALHELGHQLGLNHVAGGTVMTAPSYTTAFVGFRFADSSIVQLRTRKASPGSGPDADLDPTLDMEDVSIGGTRGLITKEFLGMTKRHSTGVLAERFAMAPGWAPWRPVIGERPDFMPAGLLGPHAWILMCSSNRPPLPSSQSLMFRGGVAAMGRTTYLRLRHRRKTLL